MSKTLVEFINTCPCCDEYVNIIEKTTSQYGSSIDLKVYYAGKDFDYVRKYGQVNKGTMIINERKKYDSLTTTVIENAIAEAVAEADSQADS
ncbi:thioredoxin-like (seleno)protein SaoT [Maridesulfovibrio frigidus]|uniref:thioredoxin-like (seleno)protein SaoT n=1 Tax=Maridesulfovibrio frigidus TaxID=340956 RepID=UPI0004E14379|nr:thioredoxin-like (seleno)protein SaoT [Maridesulfovibrio frigidus]